MKVNGLRKEYKSPVLHRISLSPDPLEQFTNWFSAACKANIPEPNAMHLATVSPEGQPYQRTVLLKYFDGSGFVFFTNYSSRKAEHIANNNQVSLLFTWFTLERQIAITGTAEKIPTRESAKYFATRPRNSQLGAWISRQSTAISSRQLLIKELQKAKKKFLHGEIPLPDFWGGYRVRPITFEFWQGSSSRLHDRFLYTRLAGQNSWDIRRLSP